MSEEGPGDGHSSPDEITPDTLAGTATLVLRAPRLCEPSLADTDRFADDDGVTVYTALDAASEAPDDELVVIDGLSDAVRATSGDPGALLESLLSREGGVCVLTRPWCLDWLLTTDDADLTADHIEGFEQITCLRYRRDADRAAIRDAVDAIEGVELPDNDETAWLDALEYSGYEFEAEAMAVDYPPTVAPGWAAVCSLDGDPRLAADGAKTALREARSGDGLGESFAGVEDAVRALFTAESVSTDIDGEPGSVAATILAWVVFRDGNGPAIVLDVLLELELPPEIEELIEQAVGLPPQTVEQLRTLATEETIDALEQLAADPPEDLRDEIETIRSQVETIDAALTALDPGFEDVAAGPDDAFLEPVCSLALTDLAETDPDPDTERVQHWLDRLQKHIPHSQDDHLPATTGFVAHVTALALARIGASPAVDRQRAWATELLERAVGSIPETELDRFVDAFQHASHTACSQAETLPHAFPVLIPVLIERLADDELTVDEGDTDLIANAIADAVVGIWTLGDQTLDTDPGRDVARTVSLMAATDRDFVVSTVEAVDDRLGTTEVADWLLETVEEPFQPLRDRVVGDAYAQALETLTADTETPVESLAEAARFGDDEPTTRLYRAGLRAVLDDDAGVATSLFRIAWAGREFTETGTTAHDHALAAGAGYAALLTREADPDTPPTEIATAVLDGADALPQPVSALLDLARGWESATDLAEITDDIDTDSDTLADHELEALAAEHLRERLTGQQGDAYRAGLQALSEQESQTAVRAFRDAWTAGSANPDGVAAGVALLAHAELEADADSVDRQAVEAAVETHRDELSDAVCAVFDALTGADPAATAWELLDGVDPAAAEFDRDDLERMVFGQLLGAIEGTDDGSTDDRSTDDRSTETTATDRAPSDGDHYMAGLRALARNEANTAIQALAAGWQNREDLTDDPDGLAAGVLLLAHDDLGIIDLEAKRLEIVETVDQHRARLSDAMLALYQTVVGDGPSTDPTTLRDSIDRETEQLQRADLERLVAAALIDHLADGETDQPV